MKPISTSISKYTSSLYEAVGIPQDTTVAVIGLGYVGLPLARTAAKCDYEVIGFDTDRSKVAELEARQQSMAEAENKVLANQNAITFTTDPAQLAGVDIFIVCVPTPVNEDKMPDLEPLIRASQTVGRAMQPGAMIIVESTVNPGISEEVVIPTLEKASKLTLNEDFDYAYCPERINPGDPQYNTGNIPRVLGASNQSSLDRALWFYSNVIEANVKPMGNIKEAEATKMVENAFRDINIAFVNELAMAFELEGIDIKNVIDGAATKPFGFMAHYPGCGVGGHCIPVDPHYLIEYGKQHGFTHYFLKTARNINDHMPLHIVERLTKSLAERGKDLQGSKIALLGMSYKKNIDDMRESPSLIMEQALKEAGAQVATYDPHVPKASTVGTLAEALDGAAGAIIATDHDQFVSLRPNDFLQFGTMVVVDGRNCLPKDEFVRSPLTYCGVGR